MWNFGHTYPTLSDLHRFQGLEVVSGWKLCVLIISNRWKRAQCKRLGWCQLPRHASPMSLSLFSSQSPLDGTAQVVCRAVPSAQVVCCLLLSADLTVDSLPAGESQVNTLKNVSKYIEECIDLHQDIVQLPVETKIHPLWGMICTKLNVCCLCFLRKDRGTGTPW